MGRSSLLLALFVLLALGANAQTSSIDNPPYSSLSWGKNKNYNLQSRALLNAKPYPLIEFKTCFPNGTWFGLGVGGYLMTNSEMLFFMAPTTESNQKVLSLRVTKSDEPRSYPASSPIYNTTISSCGNGMVQMQTLRPLDATGNNLTQGSEYKITVGQKIQMNYAGAYNTFTQIRVGGTPTHVKG